MKLLGKQTLNIREIAAEMLWSENGFMEHTFSISNQSLCTLTSTSDFNNTYRLQRFTRRRVGTRYVLRKTLTINQEGVFLDGLQLSVLSIDALPIHDGKPLVLRLAPAAEACNTDGLALFGRSVGNYAQDIRISPTTEQGRGGTDA
ncbi:MAG: hypothetical protein RR482_03285 [Clostridia bacterium]